MDRFLKRALIILFFVLLVISFSVCFAFHLRLKDELDQQSQRSIENVLADLDSMFQLEDRYELIDLDSAYLARIFNILMYGHAQSEEESTSLTNATRFLKMAKGTTGSIHSVYVTLLDPAASFVLSDTGVKNAKYLSDGAWISSCKNSDHSDFTEIRSVSSRTSSMIYSRTELLTFYHYISSTHWETGKTIEGCVVINFYMSPIKLRLTQALSNNGSDYILQTDHWQYSTNNQLKLPDNLAKESPLQLKANGTRYILFRAGSDQHDIDFCLASPRRELYAISYSQLLATFLLSAAMIVICVYFFLIYQNQYKRYFDNIKKILRVTTESDIHMLEMGFPENNYNELTEHILRNAIDLIEMKQLLTQEHSKRSEMEILALQSQINPHFLLNTLDFMYWSQVRDFGFQSPQVEMMGNLCAMLKYALDTSFIVPFHMEVTNAQQYLKIQKARKNLSVDFSVNIPDELRDVNVMKLILQPIIENCFQYNPQTPDSPTLHIAISAEKHGEIIEVRIVDDGVGINEERLEQINQDLENGRIRSSHIGIRNINRRLQVFYGEGAGARYERNPQGGLVVVLRMKSITAEQPGELRNEFIMR